MQLLILWGEAQAAQRRLRDTFRDSSKPDEELTLNPLARHLQGVGRPEALARIHSPCTNENTSHLPGLSFEGSSQRTSQHRTAVIRPCWL